MISGETVALFDIQAKTLLHPIENVVAAYSFDANGRRIDYVEEKDFKQFGGMIARTPTSRIFDFNQYQIINDNGRFELADQPRNPPPVLHQQVFIDYTTRGIASQVPSLARIPLKGKVVIAGDSIAAGSDTIKGEGFGAILERHVPDIHVVYAASQGAYLDLLRRNLDDLLRDRPAAFIIEFGMNDQDGGWKKLRSFETRLERAVRKIQFAGVHVILIGFPQNNTDWIRADPAITIAYNAAIKNVAERSRAPFVDVWSAFEKIASRKSLSLDVFGDAFHHPNDFGQRVYFSALLPYFLTKTQPATAFGPDYVPLALSSDIK